MALDYLFYMWFTGCLPEKKTFFKLYFLAAALEKGGVGALELVAMDMKARSRVFDI